MGCILLCLDPEKQVHKESYKLTFGLGNKWLIFVTGAEHMVWIFFSFVLQICVSFTVAFVCRSQQMALLNISCCNVHWMQKIEQLSWFIWRSVHSVVIGWFPTNISTDNMKRYWEQAIGKQAKGSRLLLPLHCTDTLGHIFPISLRFPLRHVIRTER